MIKELIDDFYLSKQTDKDRTNFWVSDAGKCPRAIYFNFKKYPKKEADPRLSRVFHHGEYVHLRLMSVLFSLGLIKATEIDIPRDELVHGRADAIISLDGKLYVVEVKSINKFGFENLEKPDLDHVKQLQLYLHFFKLKRGILVYECKDSQDLKEFYLEYEKEFADKLIEDFKRLKENIDKEIVPEMPINLESWKCKYCAYAESCKK